MVQDQLVEYINSQIKLGVTRDAIKSALLGVGWQTVDIDDTFKKIDTENSATSASVINQQASSSVQSKTVSSVGSEVQPLQKTSVQSGSVSQTNQTINTNKESTVNSFSPSDIIGSAKTSSVKPFMVGNTNNDSKKSFFDKDAAKASGISANSLNTASSFNIKSKNGKVASLVEGFIIVLLVVFAGYLFLQNKSLSSKVNGVGGQSSDLTSQVQNLTSQVQNFTSSNLTLTNQVSSITAQNLELQTELSFLAIPSSSISSNSTTTVTVIGLLTRPTKTGSYLITTNYGVKVYVKNYLDKDISASLIPLLGVNVSATGYHIIGSDMLTISNIVSTETSSNTTSSASSSATSSAINNGPMIPAGVAPAPVSAPSSTGSSTYNIQ